MIAREEQYLEVRFGDEYLHDKQWVGLALRPPHDVTEPRRSERLAVSFIGAGEMDAKGACGSCNLRSMRGGRPHT